MQEIAQYTMLAYLDSIAERYAKCTLILAILSGPKFALLQGHSRIVHFAKQKISPGSKIL